MFGRTIVFVAALAVFASFAAGQGYGSYGGAGNAQGGPIGVGAPVAPLPASSLFGGAPPLLSGGYGGGFGGGYGGGFGGGLGGKLDKKKPQLATVAVPIPIENVVLTPPTIVQPIVFPPPKPKKLAGALFDTAAPVIAVTPVQQPAYGAAPYGGSSYGGAPSSFGGDNGGGAGFPGGPGDGGFPGAGGPGGFPGGAPPGAGF